MHHFKSYFINDLDHMRVLGTEPTKACMSTKIQRPRIISSGGCKATLLRSQEILLFWLMREITELKERNRYKSNILYVTVDGFIFVGTNFRGLNKIDTFVGFKIRGHNIFIHNPYRKSLIRG